jgi:ribonucleoside-diphosphate reductase alpha chain
VGPDGQFDVEAFRHAVDTMILAQEIIVDNASYPTQRIGENSHRFRPLGLGFANLGALLMSMGVPYDSDQGRDIAGAITSVMCGQAYLTSSRIAESTGPFPGYPENEQPFLEVVRMHRDAVNGIRRQNVSTALYDGARQCWDDAYESGRRNGYRNAQVTVIAPTGTIGFMMDCDTTGIEPDLALIKYKKLVGGGVIKIVNNTVPQALIKLGYSPDQVEKIVSHIDSTGTIEGAPHLKPEHLAVFDCSFRPQNGTRSIHYMGHVRMMAAVQPFISGAISKTVNLPETASVEDIEDVYLQGWKLGLKALAVYRDNCKVGQPLSAGKEAKASAPAEAPAVVEYRPKRTRLPRSRPSKTTSFTVGGAEGYMTAGSYPDDGLGEVFLKLGKQGSTLAGVMDAFSIAISIALQYGVPLETYVQKFANMRFEPAGLTDDPDIRMAQSILDYIFRRLALDYLDFDTRSALGIYTAEERTRQLETGSYAPVEVEDEEELDLESLAQSAPVERAVPADTVEDVVAETAAPAPAQVHSSTELLETLIGSSADAPLCMNCGTKMRPAGSCFVCEGCGSTSGCS